MAPKTPKIQVTYASSRYKQAMPFSKKELSGLLALLSARLVEVKPNFATKIELVLGSDYLLNNLNQDFLNCPGPTNTLAFPASKHNSQAMLYLSVETFTRECRLYGQDEKTYALHLLAHAAAHLAGYDHGPEMDLLCATLEQDLAQSLLACNQTELAK